MYFLNKMKKKKIFLYKKIFIETIKITLLNINTDFIELFHMYITFSFI